jgi:hypothetical protein
VPNKIRTPYAVKETIVARLIGVQVGTPPCTFLLDKIKYY